MGQEASVMIGDLTDDAGGFVFTPKHGMAVGFGTPSIELADDLRSVANEHGMVQEGVELHLPAAAAGPWIARADTRELCEHRIQILAEPDVEGSESDHWEALLQYENVVVASVEDARLETLPRALRGEFAALDPWPVVVACLAGGSIASIASAFVETEAYFDVSIDTVSDFRRAGFGASCAAALIQHQERRGKRPVWMVRENNRASLALSNKLGFKDAGRVIGVELG